MKTSPTPDRDPLENILHQWSVPASLPPRFQEQVWQRIERAQTPAAATLWRRLVRVIEDMLPRPSFAVAYLAVILAVGGAAGTLAAQARTSRLEAQLGARYVHSIDPFLGA